MDLRVSLIEILKFVEASALSRSITEAERILKAKHLITCGIKSNDENRVCVFAMCLQTSALLSQPHTIEGILLKKDENLAIGKVVCTCKGGAAGICKHSVAILLYCNRNNVLSFDDLSSTDIACLWSAKSISDVGYETVPLQDLCHITSSQSPDEIPEDRVVAHRDALLQACPTSALARHSAGRNDLEYLLDTVARRPDVTHNADKDVVRHILRTSICSVITKECVNLPTNLSQFYEKFVKVDLDKAVLLANLTSGQNNDVWHRERKLRITGSICYVLYTYSKNKSPVWEQKYAYIYRSNFKGTPATSHGILAEEEARKQYILRTNYTVLTPGILIHPEVPWLGFSPDGLVITSNSVRLLEIKCPMLGKTMPAAQIIPNLQFLRLNDGNYALKQKHKFYGQVQLGMFLTNAKECDLVIFATYDKSYVVIKELYNTNFVQKMIGSLSNVYFTHILPRLFQELQSTL